MIMIIWYLFYMIIMWYHDICCILDDRLDFSNFFSNVSNISTKNFIYKFHSKISAIIPPFQNEQKKKRKREKYREGEREGKMEKYSGKMCNLRLHSILFTFDLCPHFHVPLIPLSLSFSLLLSLPLKFLQISSFFIYYQITIKLLLFRSGQMIVMKKRNRKK